MKYFDPKAMLKHFNRRIKALSFSQSIADNLLERLNYIKMQPQSILDLGCGTGELSIRLSQLYPKAKVTGLDIAGQRLKQAKKQKPWFNKTRFIEGDIEHLPFPDNSFDLMVSNLSLYWVEDLNKAFKEIQRVLKPEGVLLFSSLGPDTLQELRASFAKIDDRPHVNVFLDMHEVGDILLKTGLKDPVMDVETLKFHYASLQALMNELRHSGESNVHTERHKGLTGKTVFQQLQAHYESYRNAFEKLPATFEVVYGHALGTENLSRLEQEEVHVPLSQVSLKPKKT